MRRTVSTLIAALIALTALGAPADAEKRKSINTPGYKGTRKAPRTRSTTPAPATIGVGLEPGLIVDAAGTAHVVWTDNGAPHAMHYCRLKRGARTCDVARTFPPTPELPGSTTGTFAPPVAVAYGDQLVLLQQRWTGQGGPVYAHVSGDGGTTFLERVVVGGPVGGDDRPGVAYAVLQGAVTFGQAGAEQIGLVFTDGFFQAVRPGVPPQPMTDLKRAGDDPILYDSGSIAGFNGSLSVAYGAIPGAIVRTWNRAGDVTDPAQWSAARVPESTRAALPLITSGPSGTFVQTQHPSSQGATLQLRKLDAAGVPGQPIALSKELLATPAPPAEDAAGNVTTAWTTGQTLKGHANDLVTRTVIGGTRAGALTTLLPAKGTATLLGPRVGVAADGGGFVAGLRVARSGTPGSVLLVAFGTQRSSGKLGLGNLPGSAPNTDPGVLETCSRIEFGAVDVVGKGGCLLSAIGDPATKVAETTIRLNGLEIVPDTGVKILLNSRARTINTTGAVTVQLRADTVTIPLFRGELHLDLPSGDPDTTQAAPGCTGTKLLGFDSGLSKPALKGFPILGQIAVFLKEDSLCIPVALGLPSALGGIRGNAVLEADNTRGLHLTSLHVVAPAIPVGPVLIQDLEIRYDSGPDSWTGGARLTFPPGFVLGAKVTFQGGDFKGATVTVSPLPWPGTPLFSGIYLNSVTGGFGVNPLSLTIGARVGALPTVPPDGYAVAVAGAVTATFKDPFTLELGGTGELFGFQVARLDVLVNSDLYFQASANVDIDLSIAAFSGGLKAFVDGPRKQFGGEIAARLKVFGYDLASAEAVVSSRGLGGCATIDVALAKVEIGAGYKWGDPIPLGVNTMWGDCDLGAYRLTAAGARAQAAPGAFTVAAGSPLVSLRLVGVESPPSVVLVSPTGERITPVAPDAPGVAAAKAIAGMSVPSRVTFIAIPKPAVGAWGLELQPGSSQIAEIGQATPRPDVKVDAKVGGRARSRTLTYAVAGADGRRVSFFEATPRGERLIGAANGANGTLRFASAPGAGGRRVIQALIEQDGVPRDRRQVASYVAPAASRPAAVTRVRARRAKGGVVVTWRGGAGATSYLVRVSVGDGRRSLYVATRRRLRIPAIPRTTRVAVAVRGRNAAGRLGREGRARLPRARSARARD